MYKRKEYPIKSYVPMRTNKDRTCVCCGDTIPAGSSRMIPNIDLYSVNYNPEPVSSSPKVYCDYYIDDRNIGTPLTDKGYVDWDKMLVLLRQNNLL